MFMPYAAAEDGGGFHKPSIEDFFPEIILFEGTPFAINRIILIRFLMVAVLIILFTLATRNLRTIPTRGQSVLEMATSLVSDSIAKENLGEKEGKRFLPILTSIFFIILAFNITGIIPGLNIAASSTIGFPLVLAVFSYFTFIYAGLKKHSFKFIKNSLVPSGVPLVAIFIVTPIELVSTFIIRPATLALRLLMNMIVGHFLLVLFFSATQFFVFYAEPFLYKLLSPVTLGLGLVFTLFEILVAVLQAYVFTVLTAVYIQLALADEH